VEEASGCLGDLFVGAVTIGERGQVVIPAEARKRCAMEPGDKLLVFIDPVTHGITMVKVDQMHLLYKLLTDMLERLSGLEAEDEARSHETDSDQESSRHS
jgi:AbrB family looped-hinge helix DNA binding protein